MKQWKRLVYYLLINVLVSACTTVVVLYFWDRTHHPASEVFSLWLLMRGSGSELLSLTETISSTLQTSGEPALTATPRDPYTNGRL